MAISSRMNDRQLDASKNLWRLGGGFDSLLLRLSGGDDGGTAGFFLIFLTVTKR
jgi:hypothetical protein